MMDAKDQLEKQKAVERAQYHKDSEATKPQESTMGGIVIVRLTKTLIVETPFLVREPYQVRADADGVSIYDPAKPHMQYSPRVALDKGWLAPAIS